MCSTRYYVGSSGGGKEEEKLVPRFERMTIKLNKEHFSWIVLATIVLHRWHSVQVA